MLSRLFLAFFLVTLAAQPLRVSAQEDASNFDQSYSAAIDLIENGQVDDGLSQLEALAAASDNPADKMQTLSAATIVSLLEQRARQAGSYWNAALLIETEDSGDRRFKAIRERTMAKSTELFVGLKEGALRQELYAAMVSGGTESELPFQYNPETDHIYFDGPRTSYPAQIAGWTRVKMSTFRRGLSDFMVRYQKPKGIGVVDVFATATAASDPKNTINVLSFVLERQGAVAKPLEDIQTLAPSDQPGLQVFKQSLNVKKDGAEISSHIAVAAPAFWEIKLRASGQVSDQQGATEFSEFLSAFQWPDAVYDVVSEETNCGKKTTLFDDTPARPISSVELTLTAIIFAAKEDFFDFNAKKMCAGPTLRMGDASVAHKLDKRSKKKSGNVLQVWTSAADSPSEYFLVRSGEIRLALNEMQGEGSGKIDDLVILFGRSSDSVSLIEAYSDMPSQHQLRVVIGRAMGGEPGGMASVSKAPSQEAN